MTTFRKTLLLGGSFYLEVSNAWGQPPLLLCVGSADPPSRGLCLHRAAPEVLCCVLVTQEQVPTRVRVAMSACVLPMFYRPAAKQLGMCRSPVGKLLLVCLCLPYEAEGGGDGGTEPFIIPMRTWETAAHPQTGQCCSGSTRLPLASRKPSFKFLNLMILTQ